MQNEKIVVASGAQIRYFNVVFGYIEIGQFVEELQWITLDWNFDVNFFFDFYLEFADSESVIISVTTFIFTFIFGPIFLLFADLDTSRNGASFYI